MPRVNEVNLEGKCVRIDARKGMSKNNQEFISMTFTLSIEGNQIKVESFSMRHKKDGSELTSYQGLMTLFEEATALHKTIKEVGMEKGEEVADDTIVGDIEDCSAISFSNYGKFKYCRLVENSFMTAEGLKKTVRIEGVYPNRVDQSKREYKPKHEFEVCGLVIQAPFVTESIDGEEYLIMTIETPIYQEPYGEREASVTLHEVQLQCHDPQYFDYIVDNFELGTKVYLNGQIVRKIQRVENVVESVDDTIGFGRKVEHKPQYKTAIEEYFEILGGYELEEDDLMPMEEKEFNAELWQKAKVEKDLKLAEMRNGNNEPKKQVGFGKPTVKEESKKVRNNNLPF